MKKSNVYSLASFSSLQVYLFQRKITDAMREGILEITDEDTFISKALELVKINGKANDQASKARQILTHFLGQGHYTDYKELFLEKILGIREIPYKGVRRIEAVVKQDLKDLNALISHYQQHDYIKKLIEKDESPRNHEEKILHDFYKRCLREREIILDYLLNGIGQRAIASMYILEGALIKVADYSRSLRERPYQFWNFFKEGYVAYRSHRAVFYFPT